MDSTSVVRGDESDDGEATGGYVLVRPSDILSNASIGHRRKRVDSIVYRDPPAKKLSTIRLLEPVCTTDQAAATREPQADTYCLREFAFENHPPYVALSYVWGPENAATDESIIIDGAIRPIRKNLSQALGFLAHALVHAENGSGNTPSYIWVDAICINQSDDDEKSQVVPQMGQIFASASHVYAWLGPFHQRPGSSGDCANKIEIDEEDCELVLSSLECLGELFWQHSGDDIQRLSHESLDLRRILEECVSALVTMFSSSFPADAYTALSNQPYWRRTWVLQEVYLAQRLLFFCGQGRVFPSKQITGGVLLVEAFRNYVLARESSTASLTRSCPALHRFAIENPSFPEMHRMLLHATIYDRSTMSLRIALTNFCLKELPHGSKASDARDMVFGLLGFATNKEQGYVKANYELSPADAYIEATRVLIAHGFTDLLSWAQPANKKMEGLPTWVPDYAGTIYTSLCSQAQAKPWLPRFNAGGLTPRYQYEVIEGRLFLSAAHIDKIAIVGDIWSPHLRGQDAQPADSELDATETRSVSHSSLLCFLQNVGSLCDRAHDLRSRRSKPSLPNPPSTRDSAWRVPCADQVLVDGRHLRSDPRAQGMHAQLLDALRHGAADSKTQLPAECRPYIEMLLRFANRRAFVTKKGYVGLGPGTAKEGDKVVVFSGFAAAYVVRKLRDFRINFRQDWCELVGEAYVDGFMDDEAAKIQRRPMALI